MIVVLGKNLGQIRSNVVKNVMKRELSTFFVFFSYFIWGYFLKQKEVVVQTPA